MGQGKSATQGSEELRGPKKAVGKSSMAYPTENTRHGKTREEMTVEEVESGSMQCASEGIQDDVRLSPKRKKKMKIEKIGELPTERTRNTTRRAAYKTGSHNGHTSES
jgi:hypothetical protein